MTHEGKPDDDEAMRASFKRAPNTETRKAVADYVQHDLAYDLPLDVGGCKPTKRVEKRWWDYLRWLYDLQLYYAKHNLQSFSILPLSSFATKYITMDTDALRGLLKRVWMRTTGRDKPKTREAFYVT